MTMTISQGDRHNKLLELVQLWNDMSNQTFVMVDYIKEMAAKKFCKYMTWIIWVIALLVTFFLKERESVCVCVGAGGFSPFHFFVLRQL